MFGGHTFGGAKYGGRSGVTVVQPDISQSVYFVPLRRERYATATVGDSVTTVTVSNSKTTVIWDITT